MEWIANYALVAGAVGPRPVGTQRRLRRRRLCRIHRFAAGLRENQRGVRRCIEVEHVVQGARDGIEGARNSLTVEPVVFDETEDRALIGDGMIDEILRGEWR